MYGFGELHIKFSYFIKFWLFSLFLSHNSVSASKHLINMVFDLLSALRRPPVRRFLNLPDVVPEPNPATQPDMSFLRTSKSMTETPSPLPAKESEQINNPERRISSSSVINQRIRSLEKSLKARNKLKKR